MAIPLAEQQVSQAIDLVNGIIRGAAPNLVIPDGIKRTIEYDVQSTVLQVLNAATDTLKSQIISGGAQNIGTAIGTLAGTTVGGILSAEIGGLGVAIGAPAGGMLGAAIGHMVGVALQNLLGVAVDQIKHDLS